MSGATPVSITIMDKEYVVSCPPGEEAHLREAARVLGERMTQAREAGKTLGAERVAVVTALNVVHEMLGLQREHDASGAALGEHVARIGAKLGDALGGDAAGRRSTEERVD